MITSRARFGLLMLAFAAFAYNTSESFPIGLLPEMSADFGVSESRIGILLTVYAAVVAITVIPLVVMTSHVARRRLVLITVVALFVSNLAVAAAPTYEVLMAARLLSATTHGVFWSMIAPTAAMLVPRGREGYATAMAFAGSSLAMVAGTPLAAFIGDLVGWRTAAACLALAAGLTALGLRAALPALRVTVDSDREGGRAPFLTTLTNRALLGLCSITIVVVVAYFATYTYISLFIERSMGLTGSGLSLILALFGLAGLAGVFIVGKVTDRHPRASAIACVTALAVALLGIGIFMSGAPIGALASVILLGASFTAVPVCLQAAVLRVVPAAGDVASSVYVVAFQIGIAGGSLLGGLALTSGYITAIPIFAAAVTGLGALALSRSRAAFPTRASVRDGEAARAAAMAHEL